jgi:hypothetical protein
MGSGRLCIDYHLLNEETIKNMYLFPSIDNLLDQMKGTTVYSRLIGDQVITS